jgi:2-desacetyl-2-hydroxyethyl bacteriochlorophyllide A dehydrogenase
MNRRSLFFTGRGSVEVREEPLPQPATGQVMVETLVSAISAGTERLFYRGQAPSDIAVDSTITALSGNASYPLKYGYCAVGRVIEIGQDVSAEWMDRRVFAFNPHESHFLADSSHLMPVPEGIAPEAAVFLPNMETAVNLVMDGQPMIGDQVAVIGQGVVGLLTTGLLAQFPLANLITLDRLTLRREWSLRLGADSSLDPDGQDATAQARNLLTANRPYSGADLSYELSGAPQALNTALALTGFDGTVIIGSWYGQKRADLDLGGYFHRSRIRLVSSQVSTINPDWQGRWSKQRRFQLAWDMLRKLNPERLITHRVELTDAQSAYAALDQTPADMLQVILTYP